MKKVFINVETTGLVPCQILQIAGISADRNTFDCYLRPTVPIDPGASQVNGLYLNEKGQLVRRESKGGFQLIETKEIAEGLQQFFDWAQSQGGGKAVKLVAYNGKDFAFHILKTEAAVHNIETHGLLKPRRLEDPFKKCKKLMGMRGWRKPKLVEACNAVGVMVDMVQLHDAMGKSIALMDLVQKLDGFKL